MHGSLAFPAACLGWIQQHAEHMANVPPAQKFLSQPLAIKQVWTIIGFDESSGQAGDIRGESSGKKVRGPMV